MWFWKLAKPVKALVEFSGKTVPVIGGLRCLRAVFNFNTAKSSGLFVIVEIINLNQGRSRSDTPSVTGSNTDTRCLFIRALYKVNSNDNNKNANRALVYGKYRISMYQDEVGRE